MDLSSFLPAVRRLRPSASAAGTSLDAQREEHAAALRAAGWQVVVARAGDPVARVWAAGTGRSSSPDAAAALR